MSSGPKAHFSLNDSLVVVRALLGGFLLRPTEKRMDSLLQAYLRIQDIYNATNNVNTMSDRNFYFRDVIFPSNQ